VENVSRSLDRIEGEITTRSMGRMVYVATLDADGTVSRLTLQAWAPRTSGDAPPMQDVRLTVRGDSVAMHIITPAGEQTRTLPTRAGALLYLNPSFALMDQLLVRARRLGGDSVEVPVFLLQGGQTTTATVTWPSPDSAGILLGGSAMQVDLGDAGWIRGASVPAQRLTITRVDGAHVAPLAVEPPDYSAPEGAPYAAEDVTVPTPMGHTLAGTLTRPHTREPVPAVVMITGSGSQDRDEALPMLRGFRPFRQIADTLSRRGIAVLRLDDRGFGASTGDAGSATSADFADDIRAALEYLRGRADIDDARLGLIGHSEGGMIAPMVAASDTVLSGIVLIAGPAWTGRRIIEFQQRYAIEQSGTIPPAGRDSAMAAARRQLEEAAANQPWMRFFLDHDPLPVARQVRTPVLVLQGETDRQVTAEQAAELGAAFRAGGNPDVTVHVLPGINHLMLRDPDGNPAGYVALDDRNVAPEVLAAIVDWLVARVTP
jgi:uncharacterized protein